MHGERVSFPGLPTLQELIDARIASQPEEIAVSFAAERLSYGELGRRAGRLQAGLARRGAGRGDLVAVHLNRCLDLPAAILAVLRLGAACLPLDPDYPAERLERLLGEARPRLILSESALAGRLPPELPQALLGELAWEEGVTPPTVAGDDSELAYVLYTSGSTGQPKGVLLGQAGLRNRLLALGTRDGLALGERFLHKAPLAFDAAIHELLAPLIHGAEVVIASPDGHRDPAYLIELIRERSVTGVHFVPSLLAVMLDEDGLEGCAASLRYVLVGGERLEPELVRRFRERLPGVRLYNQYGPTEASINVSAWRCDDNDEGGTLPVGTPLANCELAVLDDQLAPVANGVRGELCVGGVQLALGYLGDPELTKAKFVEVGGRRLYRTGDLASVRADGAVVLHGRLDRQLKVRGFRVMPEEVEQALLADEAVAQVAVVGRRRGGSDALSAYIVWRSEPDATGLAARLRNRLPGFMCPQEIITLPQLPLNANLKVDYAGLTEAAQVERAGEGLPAWLAVELIELGLRPAAELTLLGAGGDSLTAIRLRSRLARRGIAVELSELLGELSLGQLAERAPSGPTAVPSSDDSVPATLPLSAAQQGIWLQGQLRPSGAYNVPLLLRLDGPVDESRLEQAFQALVSRHPLLSYRLRVKDGEPSWVPGGPPTLIHGRALEIDALAQTPFRLEDEPPLRALWAAETKLLLLVFHHLISDADVLVLVQQQLATAYADRELPPSAGLSALKAQAEQERLQPQVEARAYWRQALADTPPLLDLPEDATKGEQGLERVRRRLDDDLNAAIISFASEERCTSFAVLAAATAATLSLLSGQDEVVMGTPVARRPAEFERTIALFADTVPLHLGLVGAPSLRALTQQARERILDALTYELPFTEIVSEVNPLRLPGRHAIYQVVVQAERLPAATAAGDVVFEAMSPPLTDVKVDLLLAFESSPSGELTLRIDFDRARHNLAFAERLATRLEQLLKQSLAEPDRPLRAGVLLTDKEQSRLLGPLSHGERSGCAETVAELFAVQAAAQPNAVAARLGERRLSYGDLDRRSDRFAVGLRAAGVAERTLVGVSLPRSFELLVTLVGLAKAGCAYLPLDPDYPPERLEAMLSISGIKLVVADPASATCLPTGHDLRQLDPLALERSAEEELGVISTRPDDLIYVMFTSGSTGEPKGAALPQAGVVRLAKARQPYTVERDDVWLHMAPLAFDASTLEIWPALLNGAAIAIMPPGQPTLERIGALIREQGVTIAWMTAPLFQLMVEHHLDDLRGMRHLLTGGDVVSPEHMERARRELPQLRLINGYGPTEATVFTCCYSPPDLQAAESPLPIGYPFNETEVYVLDEELALVPFEAPGELFIGGPAIAQGYYNRPELSAERFVDNPYRTGQKLYRSGDLVRRRATDGQFSFLGRRDTQVKVRGFRIELTEVEAALRELNGVTDAVAAVRGEGTAKELVAYLLFEQELSPAELATALSGRIPSYLIPSSFLAVDEIPLNPSNKVDRRRLAELGRPLRDETFAAASSAGTITPVAAGIIALWEEVLGYQGLGLESDFFAAGGNSLSAVRLVARLHEHFELELELADFFAKPTVEAIVALVEQSAVSPTLAVARSLPSVDGLRLDGLDEAQAEALLIASFGEWQTGPGEGLA